MHYSKTTIAISAEPARRDFLNRMRELGCEITEPDPHTATRRLHDATTTGRLAFGTRCLQPGKNVVIGVLGGGHIGDMVCLSTLPRKLSERYGCKVHAASHRCAIRVLRNNPYIAGFVGRPGLCLNPAIHFQGHVIHRVERAFGLPMDLHPRGEIYLGAGEREWVAALRSELPPDRPIALLSRGSITDSKWSRRFIGNWRTWALDLSRSFTVLQPAVRTRDTLEEIVAFRDGGSSWAPDEALDGCLVMADLPLRYFLALFSIAHLFIGANTGGAHAAAAFGVPSIIVLDRAKYAPARLFRPHPGRWLGEDFLYPQHTFLWA